MRTTAQTTAEHKENPRVPPEVAEFYVARVALMAAYRRAVPAMSDAQALTEASTLNNAMIRTIVAVRAISS